jgi:hypothetical protein
VNQKNRNAKNWLTSIHSIMNNKDMNELKLKEIVLKDHTYILNHYGHELKLKEIILEDHTYIPLSKQKIEAQII